MLKEREEELPAETLQKGTVHAVHECSRRRSHIFQNTHPKSLMGKEQDLSSVEGGNGDPCTFTDLLYTCPAKEVIPQRQEDKP